MIKIKIKRMKIIHRKKQNTFPSYRMRISGKIDV